MTTSRQVAKIEKVTNGSKPFSSESFSQPAGAVEADDLHSSPMAKKTSDLPDEALKRANEERLAKMEIEIEKTFSDPEKEFASSASDSYSRGFWSAKKRTEEARKIADDRWAFKFRQKYIRDRIRLATEESRAGESGPLTSEKTKLLKEYLELKLPNGFPPEQLEVEEGGVVDPPGEQKNEFDAEHEVSEAEPEIAPIIPGKTLEELKANWDASADEYKKARGHAKGSRGFLTKLLGLSKKGFSENVEEMEEVKNARSKYLQDREAHLNAWKEAAFKEYQEELESKKGTVSEEELKQMRESFGEKLEAMAKYHNTIADLDLQDGFTKEAVEYYKTKGGPLGKVFGKYIDLYNNVYLKKVPPKVRAAISIAMMGGAVAGVAGAFGVAGGFAAGAALVSRPVRFLLAPLMPAMTYAGTGKIIEKGQKWLRAKKAEKKTAAAGEIIEKMKSGEVSVEDTMKNLDELLKRQSGEYGEELVKRGWTEDRCEQARNILTIFVGARAAMVLMSGTEAISSFFEAKGSVAGAVGASPKGALYTQGSGGKTIITEEGMKAIKNSGTGSAKLSPENYKDLRNLSESSGSKVKSGGGLHEETKNSPVAGAEHKPGIGQDHLQKHAVVPTPEAEQPYQQEYSGETRETEGGANFEPTEQPSDRVLYEYDTKGKITGLSSRGDEYFKKFNIEPHESKPGSYDQFQKSSVVPEPEVKMSEMRAPDADPQVTELGNRELGVSKIYSGGGIERSAQDIIKANPKAFGLNPDEPGFKGKVGEKAHELAEGLAKKLGFEGKGGFQRFNEIVSHKVQKGEVIKIFKDSATGKFNLTYNGKAFGNGVFTGDVPHSDANVSRGGAAQEIAPSKPKIAVDEVKAKTGVVDHQPSRGAGKKPDWMKPYDEEIARSKKNFDFYNVESQKAHDALRASQEMSLRDSAKLSRITDLIHNRGSFARIFGVEHMDWDKPADDFISGHKGVVSQFPENQTWKDLQEIKFREEMAKELERRLGPAKGVTLQKWLSRLSNEQFRLIEKSVRVRLNYR